MLCSCFCFQVLLLNRCLYWPFGGMFLPISFGFWLYTLRFVLVFFFCAVQNNCYTRHLAKILIHLAWCLQECTSTSGITSSVSLKATNALFISSVFLKHLIENAKSDNLAELCLSLDESEPIPSQYTRGINSELIQRFFLYVWSCMHNLLRAFMNILNFLLI